MKKILTVLFAMLLLACLNVSCLAAGGSFVSSPSAKTAPTLIAYNNASADCKATIVVRSYSERDTFDAQKKKEIEAAYNSIVSAKDLGDLCADTEEIAAKLGVSTDTLLISDLFDISYENCTQHENHKNFTITVEPTSVVNYAGLLHYDNGEWELLESTSTADGRITFTIDDLSPFAIVVHDGNLGTQPVPQPGVSSDMELKFLAAAIVGISLIVIAVVANKISRA
jgi:hypothetical protein